MVTRLKTNEDDFNINLNDMKRVSIKDIAQKVGVSNATVSLVLNGKEKQGRVSKDMAERIRQVVREMHYQPNRLARSLQSGKSQTIGLLVADISNPFFGTLAFYVQNELEKAGYAVIIMNTNESDTQMGKMIELLRSRQVDGFIIVPTEFGEEYIRQLLEANLPLVLVDRCYPDMETANVLIDNYQATREATRLLLDKGCKRIALLIYDNSQPHMAERKRGYVETLTQAKVYDKNLIKAVNYRTLEEDIQYAVTCLVKQEKDVDGILFATNTIAIMGIKSLLNMRIRIPDEIRIVCFDKSDAFDFMPVAIPYIHQPIANMGRKAVEILLEEIENKANKAVNCQLYASLIQPME